MTAKSKVNKTVLVIAAHPDDEVLGCGGTILRHVRQGDAVSVLILGEGIASRGGSEEKIKAQIEALQQQAEKAAKTMKLQSLELADFPDNAFDMVPLLEIVQTIELVKKQIQPDVVYTHHCGDLNIDHQITQRAVLTAFRPLPRERCKELYAFEIPSATGWNAPTAGNAFLPDHFVNVDKTLSSKLKAMTCYTSESRKSPHPRSPESLTAWAHMRGSSCGLKAAEAFMTVRRVVS